MITEEHRALLLFLAGLVWVVAISVPEHAPATLCLMWVLEFDEQDSLKGFAKFIQLDG